MAKSQEPLARSAMRSLLVAAFGIIGLMLGFVPATILFTALTSSGSSGGVQARTSYQVASNVDGKREALKSSSSLLLRIDVQGMIGGDSINASTVEAALQESQGTLFDEGRIKGVFVVINTPGGTVFDSDGIYRQIKRYKEKYEVPVVAFVNGLCASGGMYIASAADQVYATDSSLVGSVGVIMNTFLNVEQMLTNWGVTTKTIIAGKEKDAMNPFRTWEPNEEAHFQLLANNFYMQFIDIVTNGRPRLDREKLIYEYGARVYPADKAAEYGFIDGVVYDDSKALQLLVESAGLTEQEYQVVSIESRNWWSDFVQGSFALFNGKVTHQLELSPGFSSEFSNQFLYLYQP